MVCCPLFVGSCGTSFAGNFALWPLNPSDYEIQPLPVSFTASYVRGDAVYLGLPSGEIVQVSDSDLSFPGRSLGKPDSGGSNLLFVSRAGTVFSSAFGGMVYRSTDGGATWSQSLDVPCWRMDEDDIGNLFIGNYTKDGVHVATVYASTDEGATWQVAYRNAANDHIHTIRWDDIDKRLYIAFGDSAVRGQAFSDDHGRTFQDLAIGPREGDTDVAMTDHYVFWCSDDGSGRIFRASRANAQTQMLTAGSQYIWFAVARGTQIYVGTVTSGPDQRAALLASSDQGNTWEKLLETRPSNGPYDAVFHAESRELSPAGWLYCTGDTDAQPRSYRVRLRPG